jgi:hypothetical protein
MQIPLRCETCQGKNVEKFCCKCFFFKWLRLALVKMLIVPDAVPLLPFRIFLSLLRSFGGGESQVVPPFPPFGKFFSALELIWGLRGFFLYRLSRVDAVCQYEFYKT